MLTCTSTHAHTDPEASDHHRARGQSQQAPACGRASEGKTEDVGAFQPGPSAGAICRIFPRPCRLRRWDGEVGSEVGFELKRVTELLGSRQDPGKSRHSARDDIGPKFGRNNGDRYHLSGYVHPRIHRALLLTRGLSV